MATTTLSKREFRMSIDVTITGHSGGRIISDLVSDALQELVNRRDFRVGSIQQGRAIEYSADHDDVRLTLDVGIQRVEPS